MKHTALWSNNKIF